jgi:RHS repeat-associated protein
VKRHESLFLHTRYDAFNRRIGETVTNSAGTSTQWFVYHGQNVVLQLNASGGVTERYLCGPAVDQVLAEENGSGVVSWLLADNQGSVRDVVQFSYGLTTNVDHISYSAYGQIAHESNASANPGIGYTGQFWDGAAGMYYCQARWYDPSTGRYMSEDPTGFSAGDANLYRYVFNDPTNLVDPTGEVYAPSSGAPFPGNPGAANAHGRRIITWFGHAIIEIRDPKTGKVIWLDFGPGGYDAGDPYSDWTFPVTPWKQSTPQQDQQLIDLWKQLEADRKAGRVNSFNVLIWDCWDPVLMFLCYGIPDPPPPPPPPLPRTPYLPPFPLLPP